VRTFLAIPLPAPVTNALLPVLQELRDCGAKATWVRPENLHFTLRFFGDISPAQRDVILAHFTESISGLPSFDIALRGLGTFPNTRRPAVVWVGAASGEAQLVALNKAADSAALRAGLSPDANPYHPHVTLGRIRNAFELGSLPALLESHAGFEAGAFEADHVALLESTLSAEGAQYRTKAEFPLG